MLSNGIFISWISQVKAIEKKDSVWTSDQQIKRLLRPGSTYFNLNPYEVSSISIRQLAVAMALCMYVRMCMHGGRALPPGGSYRVHVHRVSVRWTRVPAVSNWNSSIACFYAATYQVECNKQVPRNFGKHYEQAVCFLADLSVSCKLRRFLTLSQ